MLSIHSIAAADAKASALYYESLARRDDYYSSQIEPDGYWIGSGAEKLGLRGNLREGELARLLEGFHPTAEKALSRTAGDDHKPGWDCTFSVPKSVSVLWAVADNELRADIERAHGTAVAYATGYLEREAVSTRHGLGGTLRQPVMLSGGIVAAAFQHGTSRAIDPNLHTHVIIANVTPRGRSVDLDTKHKMSAGALYRCELAHGLRDMGFAIERDGDSFRVAGVPQSLVEHWSQRRAEILAELARTGNTSARASEVAALATRQPKEEVSREVLFNRWCVEAKEHGFNAERVSSLCAERTATITADRQLATPSHLMETVTEKNSTVSRLQILHATALDAQGIADGIRVESRVAEIIGDRAVVTLSPKVRSASQEWIKSGERYTTTDMLEKERVMLDRAQAMSSMQQHRVERSIVDAALQASPTLSDQQRSAVRHLVSDSGGLCVLQGYAGAGKTFVLGVARAAWEAADYQVLGTAVSNRASRQLQTETGMPTWNTTKLQTQLDLKRIVFDRHTILVVDEAGMQSTKQLASLLERAASRGAKVVLVGDTRQLQAIDAGAPMRAIAERIGVCELTDVRRQQSLQDRHVAKLFRDGRAEEALQILGEQGRIHVTRDMRTAARSAAEQALGDRDAGKSTLCIAATHSQVRDINTATRVVLKDRGDVAREGVVVKTTGGYREFCEGDRIIFGKKAYFGAHTDESRTVWNGAVGTVISVAQQADYKAKLNIRLDHSNEVIAVHSGEFQQLDHGYASTVHKAQGSTVDTCHVLCGELTGREWSYVAGSRHRQEVNFYTSKDFVADLARDMSQARQNDMAVDYDRQLGVEHGKEQRSHDMDLERG